MVLSILIGGVDFYSNGIVAIEDYINQKPEVVRSFVQATMQGVEYAIAHASESVSILKKHQPQLNEELAIKEIPILQDLIITKAPGKRLGSMNREKMRETVDQTIKYLDLKVLVGGRSGLYQRVLEIAPASRIKWEFSALRRSMPFGATDD